MRSILIGLAAVLFLAGCSSDKKDEKPEGVVPQYQMQAIDKAKSVEDTLQQAADREKEESEKY